MRQPASFGARLFAFVIDAFFLVIFNLFLSFVFGKSNVYPFLLSACVWLYFAGFESSARQATWGKHFVGLKVTDLSGNRISFARATGRHFSKFFSALPLFLGYMMIIFSFRKQGLHDKIARTLVVKRYPSSLAQRWEDDDSGYLGDS